MDNEGGRFPEKTMSVHNRLCLLLPYPGAGHDQFEILGKLRMTRYGFFRQKLRVLDSHRDLVSNINYISYIIYIRN